MSRSTARQVHVRDDLWERVEVLAEERSLRPDDVVQAALLTLFSRVQPEAGVDAPVAAPAPEPAYPRAPSRPPPAPAGPPPPRRSASLPRPSGAARRAPAKARPLYLNYGGQWYVVDQDEFIIGRGSKYSDLAIKDANISRRHAAVVRRDGEYFIMDLGSTNGIEFHGERVDNHRIEEGAVYHLCDHEIRFSFIPPA
ncbi:MAG: FHA domain-containing protein [Deltaproteobacteria bacterium]|nr:MAG: FHA domain-containing protein [Deltaproteobacteria bacterium]